MPRLALLFVLLAAPAFAQTPLALPQFADPPESNGAPYSTFNRHILWNSGQVCLQRSTSTSWQCLSTAAQTETARASAVSQAVSQAASSAAAIYMTTAMGNAGFAAANSRIDTTNSSLSTTQIQVTGLQSTSATAAALSSAVATLNTRIDGVQASIPTVVPDTVCANATVTGLSIPLTGISSTTTITMAGAIQGHPCVVGNPSFLPLGAKGVCIASAANTVQMRFEAGGLLGSVVAIPSGTYRACVLVRP
jgi:hypothetical protein